MIDITNVVTPVVTIAGVGILFYNLAIKPRLDNLLQHLERIELHLITLNGRVTELERRERQSYEATIRHHPEDK